MANFVVLLKKNLIEMVRNKRIIIFSVVFVIVSIISALTAKFLPELLKFLVGGLEESGISGILINDGTVADSYVQYISNMGEISVLLVGIMFAGTITKEKTTGTYESLKMNGVKDHEIVLSHFVSQIILVTVSYILSVSALAVLNIVLFKQIMGVRGFVVLLYIYLLLLFMISLSLFSSCLCKKSGKSYLIVILAYFGLSFLLAFPKINLFNPFNLLSEGSNLMYYETYSLKNNLTTFISALVATGLLVGGSLLVVKNRINNRKDVTDADISERV